MRARVLRCAPLLAILASATAQAAVPNFPAPIEGNYTIPNIVEREIGKVKHAKFILLPITSQTRGHGTHTLPLVWQKYLGQLLTQTAH